MKTNPRRHRKEPRHQLSLFRAPTHGPSWRDLPAPLRRRLIKLLGQMLTHPPMPSRAGDPQAEVDDE